jgi:methyl-accepting chemotaxis protein
MKRQLSIKARLWLAISVSALAVMLLFTAVGARTALLASEARTLQDQQDRILDKANRWAGLTETNAQRVIGSIVAADSVVGEHFKAEIAKTSTAISALQKEIDDATAGSADKELLTKVAAARKKYVDSREEALKLRANGDIAGARALLDSSVLPAVRAYLDEQRNFVVLKEREGEALRERLAVERARTLIASGIALFAILAGLTLAGRSVIRAIVAPLRSTALAAQAIGEGDLTVSIDTTRADEIGELQRAVANMRDALRQVVGQARQSADGIRVASSEVAQGNADLSQRTEQTASSLQQTASSMEQITGTVNQTAEAARTANQLATSASEVAQRGGTAVSGVMTTMDEIQASSRKIADIVGTIDGIAFQTNILALNAAVEAARAGEQGRGFAVVAAEVRSLAQRSAEAAREIKTLIGTSVDRVDTGSRLVKGAGSTMGEIVHSVQRLSDIVGEISAAASEQSSGIGQVNQAVSQLDHMTQQNAALVEESAAAAESLKAQAQDLAEALMRFRLGHGDADITAAATARVNEAPAARPAATPASSVAKATTGTVAGVKPAFAGTDRRGPARATNVVRPQFAAAPPGVASSGAMPAARSGTNDEEWETF